MKNNFKTDEAITAELNTNQVKRLAQYLKPYKGKVLTTIFLMFCATCIDLLGPYLLQRAIDVNIPNADFAGLSIIAFIYLITLIINYLCRRRKIENAHRIGQGVLFDIRMDLFNHVQFLSLRYFDNTSAGKIIVRIVNDINRLNNLFSRGIINIVTELSVLVVAAIYMFVLHPRLAMATFTTVPIFLIILFLIRHTIKRLWRQVRRKLSNLNAYIHENICGMKVIQAYVRQELNRRTFHEVLDDVLSSWMKAIKINSAFGPGVEFISILGTVLIYWYGARLLQIEGVTIGVLIAFTVYLKRFWQPIVGLSNFYNQLLVAMASSERIFELIDEEPEIYNCPNAIELPPVKDVVVFDSVTFEYDEGNPVLRNVSFKASAGETIALVGPTGSGKTTIINLLSRFYDPIEGRIFIDGYDIKDVTLKSLRKRIGIMLQEPFIFSGSVADNIRYGKPDASDEEIIAVAKVVNCHDFIEEMDDGYNTPLYERGARISIGQRQLIAFARVLLANPDILILDEATASIDTHTEILLQKAIERVLKGRTSFVIAHRLSTIRNADRIMVIEDGQIVESGTLDELLELKGLYYHLYTAQYQALQSG